MNFKTFGLGEISVLSRFCKINFCGNAPISALSFPGWSPWSSDNFLRRNFTGARSSRSYSSTNTRNFWAFLRRRGSEPRSYLPRRRKLPQTLLIIASFCIRFTIWNIEIKISVLIDKKNVYQALAVLHKEFKLDK